MHERKHSILGDGDVTLSSATEDVPLDGNFIKTLWQLLESDNFSYWTVQVAMPKYANKI